MNSTDLQIWLSNTAHQREVADLQAAGLNPILSAHGTGASTPNVMTGSDSSGSGSGSSGSVFLKALNKTLSVANSAVQTANTAIKLQGSGWTPFYKGSVTAPLQPLIEAESGTNPPNSGNFNIRDYWSDVIDPVRSIYGNVNLTDPNSYSRANLSVNNLLDLISAIGNHTSIYGMTSGRQADQLAQQNLSGEISRRNTARGRAAARTRASNIYRELQEQAQTARALLNRSSKKSSAMSR